MSMVVTCGHRSVDHRRELDDGGVAKLPGVALTADDGVAARRGVKLQQELVVLGSTLKNFF